MGHFKYALMYVLMYGCTSAQPQVSKDVINRIDDLQLCVSMSVDYRYHQKECDDRDLDRSRYFKKEHHCAFKETFEERCM